MADVQIQSPGLAVTPTGRLRLIDRDDDFALDAGAAERIATAFATDTGAGLLALATRELGTMLPADLAFGRQLARAYLTALCRLPENADADVLPADLASLRPMLDQAPPMVGAEYLTQEALAAGWQAIDAEVRRQREAFEGSLQDFLQHLDPAWNSVGRVTFHLAENKGSEGAPFAFLATYTEDVADSGRARHVPLGRAVAAHRQDRDTLLRLLRPVHAAAQRDPFLKELADTGAIYRPTAWGADAAWRFLKAVPHCTAAGLVVRLPDWWQRRARARVSATIGANVPSTLGLEALLDFEAALTLDGEELTASERDELLRGEAGLRFIKGRWVEVDPARLDQALAHFRNVAELARRGQLTFHEGMRLLAGVSLGRDADAAEETSDEPGAWAGIEAGTWLREVLARLAGADEAEDAADRELLATLRPYQRIGTTWLVRLASIGLGGCLADDMGLGKTLQVIAALLRLRRSGFPGPHLLVVPASLLGNWRREVERFAPSLRLACAHRSEQSADELTALAQADLAGIDLVMTTYGSLPRQAWLTEREWGLVVLDEAQAIKNPAARQTRTVKALHSRARIALTGTPVENRLGDLWSIFDFACPKLLGNATAFKALAKRMQGERGFEPLRRVIRPYLLRRLKTDRAVIPDLPDKTEVDVFCGLTRRQAALYQQAVKELASQLEENADGMARRGLVLAFLLRFKQICNHPSQWNGDGAYEPHDSAKFARLAELCEPIRARQEKVLVFTQFRELTEPLAEFLATLFGRPGLILHGGTAIARRQQLVDRFQQDDGPPFFVLSLKAGGTGLNLTAASHVVHFDRWWNPAVENQATDRAFRIGQRRNVLVHRFVCRGTVEERIRDLLEQKRALADELVASAGGEVLLTEMADRELLDLVTLDLARATEAAEADS